MTKDLAETTQAEQLEAHLKAHLPESYSVIHRVDPSEATTVVRDGCVDLMVVKTGEKFYGSTYAFVSRGVADIIAEALKDSPVKVETPLSTHMRPEGR